VNAKQANYTIVKARQLQRKLYLAAKRNSKRRFHALYDKVYKVGTLRLAWQRVKKNKGSAGIDEVTIKQVEENGIEKLIEKIQYNLKQGKYNPLPVKRVYIPKKDGSKRPLGIPAVIDRIIQMATKIVIEPIFEADFKECSYGFRPKRNAHQALEAVRKRANNKGWYVLDADIKGYFDNINHDKLLKLIKMKISDRRIIKLIRKWLKAGVIEKGRYEETDIGAPQGGVISPLLSNIYLNYLDTLWEMKYQKYGDLYRYADDFIIVSRTEGGINKALEAVKYIMNKLELKLHPVKTKIVNLWGGKEGFEFLGFHHRSIPIIENGKRKYHSLYQWPSKKTLKSIYLEVKQILGSLDALNDNLEFLIYKLNKKITGWKNYYGLKRAKRVLKKIDNYVVKRFTIWWNRKKQNRNRRGHMTKIRRIIRDKGLKKVAC